MANHHGKKNLCFSVKKNKQGSVTPRRSLPLCFIGLICCLTSLSPSDYCYIISCFPLSRLLSLYISISPAFLPHITFIFPWKRYLLPCHRRRRPHCSILLCLPLCLHTGSPLWDVSSAAVTCGVVPVRHLCHQPTNGSVSSAFSLFSLVRDE